MFPVVLKNLSLKTYLQVGPLSSVDTGFDDNEERRKRRRTDSAEADATVSSVSSTMGWADQLQAAAFGVPLASEGKTDSSRDQNIENRGLDHGKSFDSKKGRSSNGSEISPRGLPGEGETSFGQRAETGDIETTAKPGMTPPGKVLRVHPNGRLSSPKFTEKSDDLPPRKMLRVRSDGKLSSPKPKEGAQGTRGKGTKAARKNDKGNKTLIAVLKYGSRSDLGVQIDKILSGTDATPKAEIVQKPIQAEPAKATHPFFLGGIAKSSGHKSSTSDDGSKRPEAEAPPPARRKATLSPRKARVTSKPADSAEPSATATTFGRPIFGSDHARLSRFPGALEPLWPPQGMVDVNSEPYAPLLGHKTASFSAAISARRKLKCAEINVPVEEEVLQPCLNSVYAYRTDRRISQKIRFRDWRDFRRPVRKIMTGRELQRLVRQELRCNEALSIPGSIEDVDIDGLSAPQAQSEQAPPIHRALQHTYEQIASSFTAFDRFQCETEDWAHKYAPKAADRVLQQGREVFILRDWLKGLTIHSTENRDSRNRDSLASRKLGISISKKKRKRAEDLDNFVVSSDEEANQLDEISEPGDNQAVDPLSKRSLIRGGDFAGNLGKNERPANAVVISGPHGCGKTAAIYAVAQELNFEIFEINAGSRRSGKDLLDKVGDMTRNHLVKPISEEVATNPTDIVEGSAVANERLKQDIESGRQGTMNSFFRSKVIPKKKKPGNKIKVTKASPAKKAVSKQQSSQKQSLILLEEVDVLFEEDKFFWATTIELVLQSKRPVVMTCTDENLIPLEDMVLYAVFRLTPAPRELATDYLLLVAGNEGHLLSREAVSNLYMAKGSDLRASLTELNFFCQMAIGDTKGGLEWMLIRPTAEDASKSNTGEARVVSQRTYENGMGWLSGERNTSQTAHPLDQETDLLSQSWNGWGIDIGTSSEYICSQPSDVVNKPSSSGILNALQDYDLASEALSVADTIPTSVSRESNMILLETGSPDIPDKARSDYVEGSNVLLAEPSCDPNGVSESLVLTLRACARRLLHGSTANIPRTNAEQTTIRLILDIVQTRLSQRPMTRERAAAAFDHITKSAAKSLGMPKHPQISAFDGPMSTILEDLAPYLRSIIAYDVRLEEQRRQLNALLSKPGLKSKKQRTTRASRAALEGGQKAHTRRERWFPKDTNFDLVLQSGGESWQDVLQRVMMDTTDYDEAGLGRIEDDLAGDISQ